MTLCKLTLGELRTREMTSLAAHSSFVLNELLGNDYNTFTSVDGTNFLFRCDL